MADLLAAFFLVLAGIVTGAVIAYPRGHHAGYEAARELFDDTDERSGV